MNAIQIAALTVMAAFYIAYFAKMFLQRQKGVETDQIGKGRKPQKVLVIETLMRIATYAIVAVEAITIIGNFRIWKSPFAWIGIGIAALGVLIFVIAMSTMRDSWRAGIPAHHFRHKGMRQISRKAEPPARPFAEGSVKAFNEPAGVISDTLHSGNAA